MSVGVRAGHLRPAAHRPRTMSSATPSNPRWIGRTPAEVCSILGSCASKGTQDALLPTAGGAGTHLLLVQISVSTSSSAFPKHSRTLIASRRPQDLF